MCKSLEPLFILLRKLETGATWTNIHLNTEYKANFFFFFFFSNSNVFKVIVMLKTEAIASQMTWYKLVLEAESTSYIHNSMNFDKIPNTIA